MKRIALAFTALVLLGAAFAQAETNAQLEDQVRRTEIAFAKTMADRNLEGFKSFLADETVFIARKGPLRGKQAVVDTWKPLYEGPAAPFSWAPDTVQVLDSGTLAMTSGPVADPSGKLVGIFTSIWRKEKDGKWRIVFDKGGCPCEAPKQ